MLRSPARLVGFSLAAAVLLAVGLVPAAAGPGSGRSYVSGNFMFSLDGVNCGLLKSIDGGGIAAEVINEPAGPSYFVKKHIGQPKYEDVSMQVGFSMTKGIYEWIKQSWSMNYQRKNCNITALDYSLKAKSAREFDQCLITETTIPACDGSSKEPAYMTITFAPEFTKSIAATGKDADQFGKNEQKIWLPSNFEIKIDGLDCTRVNKIDSFTVKQTTVTDDIGEARDALKEPGKLEFPNLRITFAAVDAASWQNWFDGFVVKGNNDESFEKGGTLIFLSPNRQTQLAKITFHNLGIFKLENDKAEANADQVRRMTAELYCERMEFEYLNKAIGSAGTSTSGGSATRTGSTTTDSGAASTQTTTSTTETANTTNTTSTGRTLSGTATTRLLTGAKLGPAETAGQMGTFYQLGTADFRLDSAKFTEFPKVEGLQPAEGSRCMTFDFTIRNSSQATMDYSQADFHPLVVLSDGNETKWNGYLLSVGESSSSELAPGKDATLRVFFEVPKTGATPAKFKFSQGNGKVFIFDLSRAGRVAA